MNRFENCKTLKDLYNVFNNNDVEYSNLTEEESSVIATVFETCVEQAQVSSPLIEATFNFIYNYVVNEVESDLKENKEETNMQEAVSEMFEKFDQAKSRIRKGSKRAKEKYAKDCEDSFNVMKAAFGNVINKVDEILGFTILKESILDIVEAGADNRDLFKMAEECRKLIDKEIKELEFWGDEKSLRKATQLKALVENERGKTIFEAFASGCIYIYNKVSDKLALNHDDKSSLFKSICHSVSAFANIVKAGLKIVWNTLKFGVSFIIAGTIKLVAAIVDAIMSVVTKVKDWHARKDEVVEEDDFVKDEEVE